MDTPKKLSLLRLKMKENGISAFIVFSADPHMSEYLPDFWAERSWISGFTGSAGFVVITLEKAGLWTDSRYFVQATNELSGSGFTLFKEGIEGTPNYVDWILQELNQGEKVAVNGLCCSHFSWEILKNRLQTKNINLIDLPLLKDIWSERPLDKGNPIFVHPVKYAGVSSKEKISQIKKEIKLKNATLHIVSSLDDVAWITNLRGSDVSCNPVFLSYLTISENNTILFADTKKCNENVKNHLKENDIVLLDYNDFFTEISKYEDEKVLISSNSNQSIFEILNKKNTFIIAEPPSQILKAQKNETELEGFRISMKKDAVAMVNFLYWLDTNIGKAEIDEHTLGRILEDFRSKDPDFVGNSFNEIIGYKGNGAVVHYSAKAETAKKILAQGSVLIDSGGQYKQGTTDITRVVVLGEITSEFKKDFTLVLKGMINLSMAKFSKGVRGVQLDALARLPLWKESRDYGHGTGHGVGSFLNVHEGPQNIRKDMRDVPLMLGMVCSNEPGLYRENKYGIRIENLIAVKKENQSEFGEFYSFETLTLCPIDTRAIDVNLLTSEEKTWINNYHSMVYDEISPLLQTAEKQWLKKMCENI